LAKKGTVKGTFKKEGEKQVVAVTELIIKD
jgi:hypothetical protein